MFPARAPVKFRILCATWLPSVAAPSDTAKSVAPVVLQAIETYPPAICSAIFQFVLVNVPH